MLLIIDTTKREKIELDLYGGKALKCFEFDTQKQSEDLLVAIDRILKKEKIRLKNLKAILVNRGPGSFTGTRVGVTVANTLGWTLDIPVIGYRNGEIDKTMNKIKKFKQQTYFSSIALPYYK